MIINQAYKYHRSILSGITRGEYNDICNFFKENIAADLKNGKKEFATHDYTGGDNFDWCELDLPVKRLFECRLEQYSKKYSPDEAHSRAIKQAGIDAGWIFKWVIDCLATDFESINIKHNGIFVKCYKIVKSTPIRHLAYDMDTSNKFVDTVYAISIK